MARVVIVTVGTRGDVVPYASLGSALAAAGHAVTVVTHQSLWGFVTAAGLEFAALPVELGDGPITSTVLAARLAARWVDIGRAIAGAASGADLLLLSPMGMLGYHVAEATGAASMGVYLQPLEATRAFPPPLLTTRSLGGPGNLAATRVFRVLGQLPFARATAEFRRSLGLPRLGPAALFRRLERQRWPILYGISPSVVPVPADWPGHRPMTGYWWPAVNGRLSPGLERFLDGGEAPVFIGFGSMTAPGLPELVGEALARLGRRVVVQRGAAGLSAERADACVVGDEPHALLFPRVAVVVHHGGAGTTAATLRAGVPSVCVPFTADQPFWARRLADLGAAPSPVPLRKLTADRLAAAIVAAEALSPAAQAVSRRLVLEDGLSDAVARIKQLVS